MTQATANCMAERLGNIERQAWALAALDSTVRDDEIREISMEFHRWKDGQPTFPERRDLLLLLVVIARYLEDGL